MKAKNWGMRIRKLDEKTRRALRYRALVEDKSLNSLVNEILERAVDEWTARGGKAE